MAARTSGSPAGAGGARVRLLVAPELRSFLPPRSRDDGGLEVPLDPGTPLAHLVPAAGVPLTEVGALRVAGAGTVAGRARMPVGPDGTAVGRARPAPDSPVVPPEHRPAPGDVVEVAPVRRPQPAVSDRFLLDVHLGALARRLRLLGLDVAYRNDATDDELVARTLGEDRVLLTQDHALLRRRALAPLPMPDGGAWLARAAHVRGTAVTDQLDDVLDRFAPRLAPYTRCVACGGALEPVDVGDVAHGRRLDTLVRQALDRHG